MLPVGSVRVESDRIGWLLTQSISFPLCHALFELLTKMIGWLLPQSIFSPLHHAFFELLTPLVLLFSSSTSLCPLPLAQLGSNSSKFTDILHISLVPSLHLPSFPYVSSIVTIGPVFLLGLLVITFYLGSRPLTSRSRRGGSLVGISNRSTNRSAVGLSSSGATALSITSDGVTDPEKGATSASAAIGADKARGHGRRRSSATTTNTDNTTSTDSEMKRTLAEVNSTSDSAAFDKSIKGTKEEVVEDDADDAPPSRGGILTRRRSVRRIWKDGPGDDADSEQVSKTVGHAR